VIKFGTKVIIALCDVFKKIAQAATCHQHFILNRICLNDVIAHWFLRNDIITNLNDNPHFFLLSDRPSNFFISRAGIIVVKRLIKKKLVPLRNKCFEKMTNFTSKIEFTF
jgi:hypothetical protein